MEERGEMEVRGEMEERQKKRLEMEERQASGELRTLSNYPHKVSNTLQNQHHFPIELPSIARSRAWCKDHKNAKGTAIFPVEGYRDLDTPNDTPLNKSSCRTEASLRLPDNENTWGMSDGDIFKKSRIGCKSWGKFE